jgi:hypothetical protein
MEWHMNNRDLMNAMAASGNLVMVGVADKKERSLAEVARDVRADWKKVNYAAKPYLDAMASMGSIDDRYYEDDGVSVVAYFLGNANSWRGDKAREVKAELKAMLKARKAL